MPWVKRIDDGIEVLYPSIDSDKLLGWVQEEGEGEVSAVVGRQGTKHGFATMEEAKAFVESQVGFEGDAEFTSFIDRHKNYPGMERFNRKDW